MKGGWTCMMSDRYRGAVYTGVTALAARICQHRTNSQGFVGRYGLSRLVMAERHEDIRDAIVREKALKKWRREWKIRLIEEQNPDWRDLRGFLQVKKRDARLRGHYGGFEGLAS